MSRPSSVNSSQEILFIHTWGIGDLILLTPALRVAKKLHPELRVTLLVFPRQAAIPILEAAYVNKIVYGGWKPLTLVRTLCSLKRKSYYAVLFSTGVTPWKAWLIMLLLKSKHKISEYNQFKYPFLTDYVRRDPAYSRVRGNYELLRAVLPLPDWEGVWRRKEELDLATDFALSQANRSWAESYLNDHGLSGKPILAIHPGCMARNKFRRWPVEYFVELIRLIKQDYDCHIIVIAGPDEVDVGERLAEVEGVHLLSKTSLANVAAFISRCQAFLNTDSGLGHIASCFQIPSLTIFGPGDEAQTAPFSPVSQVVRLPIHCSPCVRKKKRDCQVECLTNLKPAEVCTALKPILQKASS
ncbi:MAG: glycosyltransferase family 9 protein [Candidatus Cloacimonetes bacterium]|nr:glycosyltransferase family 9 protein [Candidatus Cloacimonadota bacterium]